MGKSVTTSRIISVDDTRDFQRGIVAGKAQSTPYERGVKEGNSVMTAALREGTYGPKKLSTLDKLARIRDLEDMFAGEGQTKQ